MNPAGVFVEMAGLTGRLRTRPFGPAQGLRLDYFTPVRASALLSPRDRFVRPAIEEVADSEDGVAPDHTGAGVAHDFSDLCSLGFLVAVDGAVSAGWFVGAVRAFGKPFLGVVQELATVFAQRWGRAVMGLAVDPHHGPDSMNLSDQSIREIR